MFDPDSHAGAIRTVVQAFFASLIVTATPTLDALGVTDEVNILSDALTSLIVSLVIGLYWLVFNWAQKSPKVQQNPILSLIVTILMGGSKSPTYEASEYEEPIEPDYRQVGGPTFGDNQE